MTNNQTVLRFKIKKPHQHMVNGDNHSDHANKAPISENTLIDHDTISEYGLSYHREKKHCLNEENDHHQLKNQNVYTTDSDEENACSVSDEHVKEDEVPHVAESGHTCPVCRKEFKSMKSLSGHMRCHPERSWRGIQPPPTAKNSPSSAISESGRYKIDDQNGSGTTMETSPTNQLPPFFKWPEIDATCSKAEMVHRCKTCNKTFPSGQALGGHQRCHWNGGVEASVNSVKLQEDENRVVRQIRNFDLNEPAMVEDEDDIALALGIS